MKLKKTLKAAFEYSGAIVAGITGEVSPTQGLNVATNSLDYLTAKKDDIVAKRQQKKSSPANKS